MPTRFRKSKSNTTAAGSSTTAQQPQAQLLAQRASQSSPPMTTITGIERTASKDEVSVLTDFSEANNNNGNSPDRSSPVKTKSLLSSQYNSNNELVQSTSANLFKMSNSFDTGFDTALQPLPEEEYSASQSAMSSQQPPETTTSTTNAAQGLGVGVSGVGDEEADDVDVGSINFLKDPPSTMTFSRRIALALMDKTWYYAPKVLDDGGITEGKTAGGEEPVGASILLAPGGRMMSMSTIPPAATEAYPFSHSRREAPSLEKAWAYFEHVCLPRFVLDSSKADEIKKNILVRIIRKLFCKASKQLQRAEPGEADLPTKLYEPVFTPHKQLGDFGLGIGLYFSTLRAMTILTILAGLVNIPNLIYFSSAEYSNGQTEVIPLLKGSAICTDTVWVPCPDCRASPDFDIPDSRLGLARAPETNDYLLFALQNSCDGARWQQGIVNYATLWLIMIGVVALNRYLRYMEVKMDEDEQTAQDYSIVIQNPPPDATNPEEWKAYFETTFVGTHVTACTIAVDNDLLVKTLVRRRELLRQIEMLIEPGTAMDRLTLAGIAAKEERGRNAWRSLLAKLAPKLPELFANLVVLTSKVQGLAQQDYPATTIFVTFEKEADQRRVLGALQCSSTLDHMSNKIKVAKDPSHLFRGTKLLAVAEPDEPSTIRWQDLNETFKTCMKQQAFTLLATLCAIALIAFVVYFCSTTSVTFSAFAIAFFNALFPMFAKWLNSFEAHASAGGVQKSLYTKIALFRWVNTAIVITIITPFTSSLTNGGGLIGQIYALFFAEIVTTNALQLLDPVAHLKRHFLAPRAATQDAMNLQFQGTPMELAERYTNMTKLVFLALWYCAIYPGAWFMCGFALLINYFVDRFSLMRSWKRQPHLGTSISQVSRLGFFPLAFVAMAVMSSYYWSAFPYDNLCLTNTTVSEAFVGSWTITPLGSEPKLNSTGGSLNAQVDADDWNYQYCLQDFLRYPLGVPHFPFIPEFQPPGLEWMTDEQEFITRIYGLTAVAVILAVCLLFLFLIFKSVASFCISSSHEPTGADQGINFSDVPSISAYVPQVDSTVFSYPLLACSVDKVDEDLLEWTDPDRPHSFYDLTKDAEVLTRGMDVSSKVVFSQIYHWIPPDKKTE